MSLDLNLSAEELQEAVKLPSGESYYSLLKLIEHWQQTIAELENGYGLAIEDYDNDLYLRAELESAMNDASRNLREKTREFVQRLDELFKAATIEIDDCIWDDLEVDPELMRRIPKWLDKSMDNTVQGFWAHYYQNSLPLK